MYLYEHSISFFVLPIDFKELKGKEQWSEKGQELLSENGRISAQGYVISEVSMATAKPYKK